MKIKKTVTVQQERTTRIECDQCKNEIKTGQFEAFEFELSVRAGDSFPSGGMGTFWEVDLCQQCANNLFNYIESVGCRVNKSDWDY